MATTLMPVPMPPPRRDPTALSALQGDVPSARCQASMQEHLLAKHGATRTRLILAWLRAKATK